MLVPLSWLKEYVNLEVSSEEFAERMIMSGSNIETVQTFATDISGVVIGRTLSVKPHEDSDHLSVCLVDVGEASEGGEALQIVCGAPNVREDILVPVALVGSVLPGGYKIKKGKLRGVESYGMICSAEELGFADKVAPLASKDGIWILSEEFADRIGADVVETLELGETVVDFEITPNRPDCLSIIGMAREAAAVFGGELRYPDLSAFVPKRGVVDEAGVVVEISVPELCPRYSARLCRDVKIEQSPWWLQRRLMFSGMRPINNIVDITNYVMLEYGHPIHAFDLRMIKGGKIVVDTAADGAKFVTLDSAERTLRDDTLMINDAEGPIAIAGVMGGLHSEIEADTSEILIEAASFDRDSVRKTSKKLGIRTEASSRYEKGVAPEITGDASARVCSLLSLTGAGKPEPYIADAYRTQAERSQVTARPDRINALLGTELSAADMKSILESLEMKTELTDGLLYVSPPPVRFDIEEEVDIIEEVGRIYGYDNLGKDIHKDNIEALMPRAWAVRNLIRSILCGQGLFEIQTYSFTSASGALKSRADKDSGAYSFVKVINPLGEETSVMRTALLPGMLEIVAGNLNKGNEELSLFEIGNTFRAAPGSELPEERLSLCIALLGESADFYMLKGLVSELVKGLGYKKPAFSRDSSGCSYHPGRAASLSLTGADGETSPAGTFGEIHPDVMSSFGIDKRVYAAELDLVALVEGSDLSKSYTPLGRYPAVSRDIALVTGEDVSAGDIEELITKAAGPLLERISLFDVYRDAKLGEAKKSLAYRLTFRSDERTLTDDEISIIMKDILDDVSAKIGATLRSL